MKWVVEAIEYLERQAPWGYLEGQRPATEPTALAILALTAHGRNRRIGEAQRWLDSVQHADGGFGVSTTEHQPKWVTGFAVLARIRAARRPGESAPGPLSDARVRRAVDWLLSCAGTTQERDGAVGHDTTLVGWPWVEGSHSWVEPSAIAVLGLKAAGLGRHARVREGVRLLLDRLLPDGGCNYGNTTVLNRPLRPQVAPTGLALLALAGEDDAEGRIARALDYVRRELSDRTATASLCYGLMGLAAWGPIPAPSGAWLEAAFRRARERPGRPMNVALLCLAALGRDGPLTTVAGGRPR